MSFNAFMAGNVVKADADKEVFVSNRFKNAKGEIENFKVRTILAGEDDKIRKSCMIEKPVKGKKGVYQSEFDTLLYVKKLIVKSVTYPDLTDAKLQESYGVLGEEELLETMLTAAEMNNLSLAVQDINGVVSMDEKIEEAKN